MKKQKDKEKKSSKSPLIRMGEELRKIKKEEQGYEKKFLSERIDKSEEREKLNYQRGLKKQEFRKQKTSSVLKGIHAKAEQLSNFGESLTKKKLLKKPTIKQKVVASSKLIKQFGNSGYRMFQSEGHNFQPQSQPIQDNRSMLFQNEYNRERKRMFL